MLFGFVQFIRVNLWRQKLHLWTNFPYRFFALYLYFLFRIIAVAVGHTGVGRQYGESLTGNGPRPLLLLLMALTAQPSERKVRGQWLRVGQGKFPARRCRLPTHQYRTYTVLSHANTHAHKRVFHTRSHSLSLSFTQHVHNQQTHTHTHMMRWLNIYVAAAL